MRALQQRLAGRPFAVLLGELRETRLRVNEFVKREPLAFSISMIESGRGMGLACSRAAVSFLVDPDGRVRYSVIGGR